LNRLRSKKSKKGCVRKVWLECAHGGKHTPQENNIRKTSSRLLQCPWSAEIKRHLITNNTYEWRVKITTHKHNHEPSDTLAEYPGARALTDQQIEQAKEMNKCGTAPKVILRNLKSSDPTNLSIPRDIYNLNNRDRADFLQGRTSLEALLDTLKEESVYHAYEKDSNNHLLRLFIAPKICVSAAKNYSATDVILMDSTYKTNR
jgi:hypothetical protein